MVTSGPSQREQHMNTLRAHNVSSDDIHSDETRADPGAPQRRANRPVSDDG